MKRVISDSERRLMEEGKRKSEEEIRKAKEYHASRRLLKYLHGYGKEVGFAWIFVAIEVVCEVLIAYFAQSAVNVIQDAAEAPLDWNSLGLWCGIMMGLAIISCTSGVLAGFSAAKASAGFGKNLRQEMYYKIQDYSFAKIDKFSTASLVTRMTTDVSNVQNSVQMILRMVVRAPFMMVFALTMAAITEWHLALIFLAIIPFLGAVLFGISAIVHPTFVRVFNAYDDLNASVQENLNGIRVVKSFGREDFENEKFGNVSYFIYRGFTHAEHILAFNSPAMQLSVYAAMLALSWFGAKIIVAAGGAGPFRTGELTSMFSYAMQILNALNMISMCFVMITISRNSAERIYEVLIEKPTITSPENALMEVPNGAVDFNHVNFKYFEDGDKDVLHDVDVHIPSGSTVGIIGATGSSKSTFISLIARLYDVKDGEGEVLVGGHNVKEYDLKTLRDAVAVVLQKNVLFTGTIRSNLLWGNESATQEQIEHACHIACADEFINGFPKGYDTPIEEGGTNVSGGQRQRLCIARALLKNPKILILDDSTSAVDTHTDALIREAFRTEIPDVTKFIVAQRILSIKDCDKILILDDGKILDQGNHEELLSRSPVYRELVETQLGGGDFDAE